MINRIILTLSSLRITVITLLFLLLLVFLGTIYQVDYGLYQAQQKFFYSWWVLAYDIIPLPGTQLLLWILSLNLIVATLFEFRYQWRNIGILLIHWGMISLLVGGFITYQTAVESFITLTEGEKTNVSAAYHDWELAIWTEDDNGYDVEAVDVNPTLIGQTIVFKHHKIRVHFNTYLNNCTPFATKKTTLLNASNIGRIEPKRPARDPVRNMPGTIISVLENTQTQAKDILLTGHENQPYMLKSGAKEIFLRLRHRRYLLPINLALKDFRKEVHQGTTTARTYSSLVNIREAGLQRDALISMNDPLRVADFTFFQASYSVTQDGKEASTLAVVKNQGRLFPYVSSIITFVGLAWHFIFMLLRWLRRQNSTRLKNDSAQKSEITPDEGTRKS